MSTQTLFPLLDARDHQKKSHRCLCPLCPCEGGHHPQSIYSIIDSVARPMARQSWRYTECIIHYCAACISRSALIDIQHLTHAWQQQRSNWNWNDRRRSFSLLLYSVVASSNHTKVIVRERKYNTNTAVKQFRAKYYYYHYGVGFESVCVCYLVELEN